MANITKWLGSRIKTDENNRLVSDTQINTWNNKADANHTHSIANVSGLQTALDGKAASDHNHDTAYAAKSHGHTIADVTGLQNALDDKAATGHTHNYAGSSSAGGAANNVAGAEASADAYRHVWFSDSDAETIRCYSDSLKYNPVSNTMTVNISGTVAWGNVSGKPSAYTPSSHGHAISEVTGLQSALDGKSAKEHTHAIANVTGLQTALDGKAASSHSHTTANITDFPTSMKNPTSFSIQLNSGAATVYDGSTAKSINITPAGIGAAAASHGHAISEINNLQATLNGKAASSHSHSDADITSISASKITGTIPIGILPQGALDRLVRVNDDTARFALTTSDVQLGDTVKVKSTGLMYYVVDESKLNSEAGYEPYTAGSATSVPWSGITGAPSTFTPSAHTHAISDITNLQTALDGKAASSHSHAIANVTGLQTALDGKAASSHSHTTAQITNFPTTMKNPTSIVVKLNGGTTEGTNVFTYDGSTAKSINITPSGIGAAAASHGHSISDITNLQSTLDGKSANGHTHSITNVSGLQTALDGKATSGHNHDTVYSKLGHGHTKAEVGLGNVDNTADSVKNVAMATKLQTYKSGSTTETYGTDYPLFAQWDANGSTVHLVCTNYTVKVNSASVADSANAVAWGNVSGKPSTYTPSSHGHAISEITNLQSTLDGKAASSHSHAIANVTGLQSALDGKAASSHSHSISNVSGLQSALDGKAASSHSHTISNISNLQSTLDSKVSNAPTLVTNWNSATNAGFYYAAKGATNAPESTLGYFGQVCKSTTSIMQVIYPEGASGDVKQYMRRGTISGSTVTWETNWACITYALS